MFTEMSSQISLQSSGVVMPVLKHTLNVKII